MGKILTNYTGNIELLSKIINNLKKFTSRKQTIQLKLVTLIEKSQKLKNKCLRNR